MTAAAIRTDLTVAEHIAFRDEWVAAGRPDVHPYRDYCEARMAAYQAREPEVIVPLVTFAGVL